MDRLSNLFLHYTSSYLPFALLLLMLLVMMVMIMTMSCCIRKSFTYQYVDGRPQRSYSFTGLRLKVFNNNIDMTLPWWKDGHITSYLSVNTANNAIYQQLLETSRNITVIDFVKWYCTDAIVLEAIVQCHCVLLPMIRSDSRWLMETSNSK